MGSQTIGGHDGCAESSGPVRRPINANPEVEQTTLSISLYHMDFRSSENPRQVQGDVVSFDWLAGRAGDSPCQKGDTNRPKGLLL